MDAEYEQKQQQSEINFEDPINIVQYRIYCSKPTDAELLETFEQYVKRTTQNDAPLLNLTKHPRMPTMCSGKFQIDQNIEDEWLLIYGLFELSKFNEDVVIRVYDNDGDILLIEAAEYLPRWLESSKSKNRVFIHKGQVHIIPEDISLKKLQEQYTDEGQSIDMAQAAARFIRESNQTNIQTAQPKIGSARTQAAHKIQQAIADQLFGMPDKKIWLAKKFEQLDEIITKDIADDADQLQQRFEANLSLASVLAMPEEDLEISPITSCSSCSSIDSFHNVDLENK